VEQAPAKDVPISFPEQGKPWCIPQNNLDILVLLNNYNTFLLVH
jgi:hypothetical protein